MVVQRFLKRLRLLPEDLGERRLLRLSTSGSFQSAVFWNMLLMAASFLFGVVSAVLVGRWLGPQGKGEFTVATLIGTLLWTFLNVGIPSAISYFLGGNRAPAAALVKTVIALGLLLSLAGIGLAAALDWTGWCAWIFGVPHLSPPMWVVLLALPFSFLGAFLQFVMLAAGRRVLFAALPAVGQVIASVSVVALVASSRLSVLTAVAATSGAQVLMALIQLFLAQRQFDWLRAPLVGRAILGEMTRYSAYSYLGNVLHFLIQRVDVLLLNALVGIASVGTYAVAVGLAELLLLMPQRVGSLFLPRVAASSRAAKAEEVRLLTSVVLSVACSSAALLAAAGPWMIPLLYGEAFAPAVAPLLLLLPGVCLLATSSILGGYLSGVGRIRANAFVAGAGLVLNITLNVALIPRWGASGAAVASSLSYAMQAILLGCFVAPLARVRLSRLLTPASPGMLVELCLGLRRRPATSVAPT